MKSHAILVPAHNSAATVEETLRSLLRQDLSSIDAVYLADDASTDATIALARSIWQSPTPLAVIARKENLGQWKNVNAAMHQMSEHLEWIHVIHSDDVAKPQWLHEMVEQIERAGPKVGSICCSWDNLKSDGSIVAGEQKPAEPPVHIEGSSKTVRSTLKQGCWWHISGCSIRMSAFRDVGAFVEHLPQLGDWEWLLRCLQHGWGVDYIPQTLIVYRIHGASVSSASFRDHRDLSETLDVIRSYAPYLTARDVCQLHGETAWFLLRRTIGSLCHGNFERAQKGLRLLLRVPALTGAALTARGA